MMEDSRVRMFNESMYRTSPADYLTTRLQLCLLAASRPDQLAELTHGLTYAGITVAGTDELQPTEEFVTLEAVNLRQHAAETLLRIYVAHAEMPPAPAVDVARRRDFRKFKELVKARFVDARPPEHEVSHVLLGSAECVEPHGPDEWRDVITGLTEFLRRFAAMFLDDAPIYNTIKHGLGGVPGSARLQIDTVALGSGASIAYPEFERTGAGHETWFLTTRWVSVPEALRYVFAAIYMIDAAWEIGKRRCLPNLDPADSIPVFWPVALRPHHLDEATPSELQTMRVQLLRVGRRNS